MGLLDWVRGRKPALAAAEAAYSACITRSRAPVFYTALGVEDTVDGRFDMLTVHAALVLRRMTAAGAAGDDLGARFMETMVRDFDANLRELGVGDISVPKRVRQMVEAFYGRAGAYRAALEAGDEDDLVAALGRNVYRGRADAEAQARVLAADVRRIESALKAAADGAILAGVIDFPPPPGAAGLQGREA